MTISNTDSIIDSRDIIERIEELEAERDAMDDPDGDWPGTDEADELASLLALQQEAEPYCPDWRYGATLIHEDYFVTYCEELVKDIGDLPRDMPGYLAIDWDATADNLRVDYTSVEFDGETYWVR